MINEPNPIRRSDGIPTTQYPPPLYQGSAPRPRARRPVIDSTRRELIGRLWQRTGRDGVREYIAWLVECAFWYADGWSDAILHENFFRVEGMLRIDVADYIEYAAEASLIIEVSASVHRQADMARKFQENWLTEKIEKGK